MLSGPDGGLCALQGRCGVRRGRWRGRRGFDLGHGLFPFGAQEPIQVQRFEPIVCDVKDGLRIDARICKEVAERFRQAVCLGGGGVEGDKGMAVGLGAGQKGRRRTVSGPSGGSLSRRQ
jgi:hypothetical protein